ncbi:4655_t:CDS:2, partial [Racocetra persica]
NSRLGAIFFVVLKVLLLCHFASAQWIKTLTYDAFPEYKINLKTPHICDKTVKQYSGYYTVNNTKHLFFWFFESRNNPHKDPIVLWFELGPCSVTKGGRNTTFRDSSWNNNTNLLFLEQPAKVGYSYSDGGDDVSTSIEGALNVYAFLQLFFKEFPKYAKLDFHIAGESYAGHYIPAIASDIDKFNKDNNTTKNLTHVNLESILIGNGLMRQGYGQCASLTQKCYDTSNVDDCIAAQSDCIATMRNPFVISGRNVYDVRKFCEGSATSCYPELQDIKTYSNREDVKSELGIDSSVTYQLCSGEVYEDFLSSGDL